MDLKDFTDMGDNIGKRVNYSINHMDFDHLESDVRQEIYKVFGPGFGPRNNPFGGLNGQLYRDPNQNNVENWSFRNNRARHQGKNWQQASGLSVAVPVASKLPGRISGIVMMTLGFIFAGIFGITVLVFGILGTTFGSVGISSAFVMNAIAVGMVPLFLGGLIVAVIGTKRYSRINRFKQYLRVLRGERFCAISDLAERVKKKPRFVCKDLSYMIEHGFFIEGHIDDQKTCFIGTDELYQQYVQARDSAKSNENPQAQTTSSDNKQDSQTEQIIAEGEASMRTIREANDAIYDQVISEKLYKMERIIGKIFDYMRKKPEQAGQLRRFTSYYMPMTEKLVTAYQELDKQTIEGENITKAKNEISNTLDTINEAYEKLYDSMYVDVAMDVSSDIAVLKTLFAQEGLAGDEMNGGTKTYE